MKKTQFSAMAVLCLLCSRLLLAQDLVDDWQGTLNVGPQQRFRVITHIEKGEGTAYKATLLSIDQSPDRGAGTPIDSVTVDGMSVKITIAQINGSYSGTIAADGNSIVGTWTQGPSGLPLTLERATPETAFKDPSPHATQFINAEKTVKLEVLDWGGTGRTLVLVPGAGNTAHVFDAFAPKLTARYHVLGVTRRGFGASSAPATGYGSDRLGDDVLAVIDALKLARPVLIGHSMGGAELSSIGSRFPDKVAGMVYLDAGYSYAFYAPGLAPFPEVPTTLPPGITGALLGGWQHYSKIPVPILAIYALPHAVPPGAEPTNDVKAEAYAKAFEQNLPTARVVRIPNATHFVFRSNEADVLREINAFIDTLK